jgi:two-component system chemotaxis sensor kinase CheA
VVAVLLDAVDRLEEFEPAQVERARGRAVLQYRDTLLPLLDVGATLDGTPRPLRASDGGALRVLVHRVGHGADGRLVGLVVDEILDIVDEDVEVLDATPAGTIAFTASVRGRVTDVLDLPALLLQAQLHPPFPRVAA